MNRFGQPDREPKRDRKQREEARRKCPICNLRPCSVCCSLAYSKEELQERFDLLMDKKPPHK